MQNIWRMAGLPCAGPGVSLASILNAPDAQITGERVIETARCIDVAASVGEWQIQASLDPNVSCLPRRLTTTHASNPTQPNFQQEILEFGQFPDPKTNEPLWFPTSGRETDLGTIHVEIRLERLSVNTPMTKADFQLDLESLPPGVRIESKSGTTYTGGAKEQWAELDRQMDEKTELMRNLIRQSRGDSRRLAGPVAALRPSNVSWIAILCGVVSTLILLIGIRLNRRRA
jgi:hypothetical protein